MKPALSVILTLRNHEPVVVNMVRGAVTVAASVADEGGFEVLALDERSGDNTLSHLSVLHGQIPQLRTLQDLAPGSAIRRAAEVARGSCWVILDRPVEGSLIEWATSMVVGDRPAAIVPGEVLAVEAEIGRGCLRQLRGGLVSAQRAVERAVRARGQRPAWSPAPDRGLAERAMLFMRHHLGLLDRPLKA
ncbi:MAG: hypothetical protein KC468_15460 [Myxococcales bacterium]|nr:hypothetical protein [Myxococcales bacterium]